MGTQLKSYGLALLAVAALGLSACGGDKQAEATQSTPAQEEASVATIEGEVFYRERIMIPQDSEVEVQLEDISRADAMATVMESVSFKSQGGPPYVFSIEYDPSRIDKRMRYALRARITSPQGDLLFTNTEYIDPFSGNPVKVLVHSMARPRPAPVPEQPAATPEAEAEADDGTIVWILETLRGEAASPGVGGKSVDLHMNAADSTAAGFSGCNRYSGGFATDGRSTRGTPIKFGPLAGTMMACAEGGELEQAYLQALGKVDAYRLEGDKLVLLAGAEVLATFTPR